MRPVLFGEYPERGPHVVVAFSESRENPPHIIRNRGASRSRCKIVLRWCARPLETAVHLWLETECPFVLVSHRQTRGWPGAIGWCDHGWARCENGTVVGRL